MLEMGRRLNQIESNGIDVALSRYRLAEFVSTQISTGNDILIIIMIIVVYLV